MGQISGIGGNREISRHDPAQLKCGPGCRLLTFGESSVLRVDRSTPAVLKESSRFRLRLRHEETCNLHSCQMTALNFADVNGLVHMFSGRSARPTSLRMKRCLSFAKVQAMYASTPRNTIQVSVS